ncbi:hypothetical protein [Rugamonas aquatica]|uniref:Uncharacterized protein n=1 Tax=Rugamonas aquatica TaxID=2743357 RepID=A0A6A7N6P2_9BURK|nr:hypothetical protein [Rugamonas aquatica]MQA40774.1 hypothetical protein [Rugamonas aquatica]
MLESTSSATKPLDPTSNHSWALSWLGRRLLRVEQAFLGIFHRMPRTSPLPQKNELYAESVPAAESSNRIPRPQNRAGPSFSTRFSRWWNGENIASVSVTAPPNTQFNALLSAAAKTLALPRPLRRHEAQQQLTQYKKMHHLLKKISEKKENECTPQEWQTHKAAVADLAYKLQDHGAALINACKKYQQTHQELVALIGEFLQYRRFGQSKLAMADEAQCASSATPISPRTNGAGEAPP